MRLCRVATCGVGIRPGMMFCKHHWRMISMPVQQDLKTHYTNMANNDAEARRSYFAAVLLAEADIEAKEFQGEGVAV